MTTPTITLEGVTYVYRQDHAAVRAVDGVSLQISGRERLALIGQNGSGKTTLVKHLNGLLRPTSGRVLVDGADAATRSVAQLAARVGLVFQDPDRQIFSGSVHSEVAFGPRNLGLRGDALRAAVDDALDAVGLTTEARTNPYDLGGSRRKLLALASVLAMRTPVLVLDEPTTGQDPAGIDIVHAIVQRAHRDGRTVVAISHDMEFVASAFDRVVVMREGRVIADGTPASIFSAQDWDLLASTYLEPPLAARLGQRLGLPPTPTPEALLAALAQ